MIYLSCYARTGATLLSKILNNHQNICVTAELPLKQWKENYQFLRNLYGIENRKLSIKKTSSLLRQKNIFLVYRYWIMGIKYKKCKWLKDKPNKFFERFNLREKNKHIIILRNPKDVFCSLKHFLSHYRHDNSENVLMGYAEFYAEYLQWIKNIDSKIIVTYENLTTNPKNELNKILNEISLKYSEDMLKWEKSRNDYISGDYKINNTRSVTTPTKYNYEVQLSKKFLDYIERVIEPGQQTFY